MNTSSNIEEFYEEEFRDTIATVDANGKRIWLHPKKPKGNPEAVKSTLNKLTQFFSHPYCYA